MLYKLPFFESSRLARFLYGLACVLLMCGIFGLDILTKNAVAFDVFYFPSIILMTWFFGTKPGYVMSVVAAVFWFVAQRNVEEWGGMHLFVSDGLVHLFMFGFICGMTGLIRKKTDQLEKKSEEIARSNTELEQFAFKAAHDLQSPLTTIMGYTELLADKIKKTGQSEWQEFLDGVLKGVERMKILIRALLDYSRVMKKDEAVQSANLDKIVRDVLENLHFTIAEKKAQVTFDPLPTLCINPGLAAVLFQNLIGNALKYCEKEPRVHISAEHQGKEWLFKIKDNGIGIAKEDQPRIFVMFERVAARNQYPGSGIGLTTCEKIVNRYGGQICVDSAPGEGSTFYFTLPAIEAVFTK